jgi:proteasome lid subunit RPN8/RPN11
MQRPWNLTPPRSPPDLCLTFSPLAWLKLVFFCHQGDTEIGGFGISAKKNPLCVEDFITVKQNVSEVSVRFLDSAVADHFDACHVRGIPPSRSGRLWIHTHPGSSALPSGTDEETFAGSFGSCDWSVMMILACGGQTYARLAFAAGPRAQIEIAVKVDWSDWPRCLASNGFALDPCVSQWRQEFESTIQPLAWPGGAVLDAKTELQELLPLGYEPWFLSGEELANSFFEEEMLHDDCYQPHVG